MLWCLRRKKTRLVVSNIFNVHPNLGKIPILTSIFFRWVGSTTNQLLMENSQRETNRTLDVKMNIAPLKQVLYERGLADKKQREQKARSGNGGEEVEVVNRSGR